ncbi:MAG: hypothetical protein ACXW3E_05870 [Thermoanaerobaculia bacterium]
MKRTGIMMLSLLAFACSRTSDAPQSGPAAPAAKPGVTAADGPKLMPIDQATTDPSLMQYLDDMLTAVRNQDTNALLAGIDPKIRTSFGAGGGIEAFKKQWKPENPGSPIWDELEHIFTLGGTFNKTSPTPQFWAPYIYSAWPEGQDSFESLAVITTDVPLHETAVISSPSIATLSFDIVKRGKEKSTDEHWINVTTADGRSGWVESRLVRSPLAYRAGLTKRSGEWKMDALVSGD